MNDPNRPTQFSVWGRVCIVLTLVVVASQVWAIVEFLNRPYMTFIHRPEWEYHAYQNSRLIFKALGGLCPSIFLSGFAGAYYMVKARVTDEDAGLAKWFYRAWAVSSIGGLTFYYLAR